MPRWRTRFEPFWNIVMWETSLVHQLPQKSSYRFLAWNLERGIRYEEQLQALRTHPYLKTCDVLLLTETDLGMARSAESRGRAGSGA